MSLRSISCSAPSCSGLPLGCTCCRACTTLAAAKGVTHAQIALAWVLSKGEDIIPIPGTKRLK